MEGMNLSRFVSLAITEIAKGIEQAKSELGGADVLINPITNDKGFVSTDQKNWCRAVQMVEFDLSVTASTESSDDVGGKISIVNLFSIGGKTVEAKSNLETSRIKFSVPVSFPTNTEGRTQEERLATTGIRVGHISLYQEPPQFQ